MFARIFVFLLTIALLPSNAHTKEGDAFFAVSPDSSYELLLKTISQAKESLEVNVYMFTNRNVARAIAAKASQGVKVTVLTEGQPHGGSIVPAAKNTLDSLHRDFEGRDAKLLIMTNNGDANIKRRFVYNHAKYVIVDKKIVFVSSENFTGSAYPDTSKNFFVGGTRGWQLTIENRALANELSKLFAQDASVSQGDVYPYEKAKIIVHDPFEGQPPKDRPLRTIRSIPLGMGQAKSAAICASPLSEKCVLDFIQGAKRELKVQHLSLPLYWKDKSSKSVKMNPIVQAIVAAAERGVRVKVLLNNENTFDETKSTFDEDEKNSYLVRWLNQMSKEKKLRIEAALFDARKTQTNYVHNKGMEADGSKVFLGSINGTENSLKNNREISLTVESEDASRYFSEAFEFDWNTSLAD